MKTSNQCKWELARDIATILNALDRGDSVTIEIDRHLIGNTDLFNAEIISHQGSLLSFPCGLADTAIAMEKAYNESTGLVVDNEVESFTLRAMEFCPTCGNVHMRDYICPVCK